MSRDKPVSVTLEISNCMDCPHHKVVPDPDPSDSFCSDDEAVLCGLTNSSGAHPARCQKVTWAHRPITVSCRPHHKREECVVPDWCPLRKLA